MHSVCHLMSLVKMYKHFNRNLSFQMQSVHGTHDHQWHSETVNSCYFKGVGHYIGR